MNGIIDIFYFVTFAWLFFETINIINIIWFKNAKKVRTKGIVKKIFQKNGYHRGIYVDVLVKTEHGNIKAHCVGWYPKIGENVIVNKSPMSIMYDTEYSCLSTERYLKDSTLKVFLIPSRILVAFLWIGYLLWVLNPEFVRNVLRTFR